MKIQKYEIGDKIFIQKALVLGQWRQLIELMKQVALPADLNPRSLIVAIGSRLFIALAIILTEEGKSPKDKDLEALASEIEFGITPETTLRAIGDFFELNPIPLLLKAIGETTNQLTRKVTEIGLMNAATFSQEETLQNVNGSSGTSRQEKPETGLNAS